MPKVLFKIPSRERPDVFDQTLSGWIEKMRGEVDVLVTLDANDPTIERYTAICERIQCRAKTGLNLSFVVGTSKGKIDAINRDMGSWRRPFDVVVLGSDDMVCERPGWDLEICSAMNRNFPRFDGALHYPDGNQRHLLTFSILGHRLYRAFGYLYHPDYKGLWCDNEFHDSVKALGRCRFVDIRLVRHIHCTVKGGLARDALYERNEALYAEDQATYNRRKAAGFDIARVKEALRAG